MRPKKTLFIILLIGCFAISQAQDTVKIYAFINQLYTPHALLFNPLVFKSGWGCFLLCKPYPIDSDICDKIKNKTMLLPDSLAITVAPDEEFTETPRNVIDELYKKCIAIDTAWQNNFYWEQEKILKYLLVKNTKSRILPGAVNKLKLAVKEKPNAVKCIRDWNQSGPDARLVNYCSIPIFTDDGNYALIIIGQDARSEGGWDSIFIYKKEQNGWKALEHISISTI